MAVLTKQELIEVMAKSGKTWTEQDVINLIESMMGVGQQLGPDQVQIDKAAIAQEVINDPTFQTNFAISKKDTIDNPNSTDVATTKAVADATKIEFTNDFFETI